MAPRARAAAPVEPEPVEEAEDYTVYATKPITATMEDFAVWITDEVYGGDAKAFAAADAERLVSLAGTLRMKFQASDFNIEQREIRKQEREAARSAPEPAEEAAPAKPARRGRAAAAAAAEPEPAAPAKPARPRRGKAATGAAAF